MSSLRGHASVEDILADALAERLGRRPRREYQPTKLRRWRIDVAYVQQKIAIEVEGRHHGRLGQARSDSEKQNWLVEHSWKCLRFPASSVLAKCRLTLIVDQVERVLCGAADADAAAHTLTG